MADSQRKTANLAPEIRSANGWVVGYLNGNDGSYNPNNYNGEWLSPNIPISSGETITISAMSISYPSMSVYYWNGSTFMYGESATNYSGSSFTTPPNTTHIRFAIRAGSDNKTEEAVISSGFWVMMNTGSTALPYEPYWQHSLRKLGTATETIQSGDTIYADGTAATITLKGNEEHTGTPTPQNPVDVNGVGVRTENLWSVSVEQGGINSTTGSDVSNNERLRSSAVSLSQGTYTISAEGSAQDVFIYLYNLDGTYIGIYDSAWARMPATITLQDRCKLRFVFKKYSGTVSPSDISNIMLNTGSTAKPYEPYGYKIPISSANTTTPVYLGEVQTTRKVYKWVLTGQEDWLSLQADTSKHYLATVTPDYLRADSQVTYVSSHYVAYEQTTSATLVPNGCFAMASNTESQRLYISDSTYTTNDAWKAYLAQQYANGTPVTVWYVLATPTTGIVNEPLMKIGNYADSLTTSIPTTDGANAMSIGTTVQPSEVTAAYHGWHDSSVKEWDGSQWNE